MENPDSPCADLTSKVIGLAMRVHRHLGPGLPGSVHEKCLCCEPGEAAIPFRRQVPLPTRYREVIIGSGYVVDIIVGHQAILELKAVERLLPIHEAQLQTDLRLAPRPVGLLINFNTVSLTEGIRRRVLRQAMLAVPAPVPPESAADC